MGPFHIINFRHPLWFRYFWLGIKFLSFFLWWNQCHPADMVFKYLVIALLPYCIFILMFNCNLMMSFLSGTSLFFFCTPVKTTIYRLQFQATIHPSSFISSVVKMPVVSELGCRTTSSALKPFLSSQPVPCCILREYLATVHQKNLRGAQSGSAFEVFTT